MAKFYENNKEYVWMLLSSLLLIIIGNFLVIYVFPNKLGFFLDENNEIIKTEMWKAVGKVWEIAGCLLTFVFNYWYWFKKTSKNGEPKSGKEIVDLITDESTKSLLKGVIYLSLIIISILIIANICLIIKGGYWYGIGSIFAPVLVFVMFLYIDKIVVDTIKEKLTTLTQEKSDYEYAIKNSDIPILIAFIMLFIYSIFTYSNMEVFFSGAIAFQLLYSTLIWANLESV